MTRAVRKWTPCRFKSPRARMKCAVVIGAAERAKICGSRSGTPASRALVVASGRGGCGLMCRWRPAAFVGPLRARPFQESPGGGYGRGAAFHRCCELAQQPLGR